MGVRTLGKGFYCKLAWGNIRRSREVYLPYLIACAIIGGIYFLVCGFAMSKELQAVPGGESARALFQMGVMVFTVFAAGFLLSINRFLVKRRKREFGLYGVLGLSKAHVGRILLLENAIVLLGGLAACYAATDTTMLLYAASLLPHGIFELPALILAFSMGLYICGHLTRRCRRDPAALPLGACLGLAARLLVFLLLPLLILAALTEAYVTPLAAGLFL